MHEVGHALHVILSRTKLQHLSGTRGPPDYVEIPSHTMENFAWDYHALMNIGRHHRTQEKMPQELARHIEESRNSFSALRLQNQIFYALVDQAFHGPKLPSPGGGGKGTTAIVEELYETYSSFKCLHGIPLQNRFTHLAWYCSSYYSYVYAEAIATIVWKNMKAQSSTAISEGSLVQFKDDILARGCSSRPSVAVSKLLNNGRPRDKSSLLQPCQGGYMPDPQALFERH